MYSYNATVVRWVDGDTVWLNVDMGFRIGHRTAFRLLGVDTPERGQPGYAEAKHAVNQWAPPGSIVPIRTHPNPDKYGRWLVEIGTGPANLSRRLIEAGLAKPYDGGKR